MGGFRILDETDTILALNVNSYSASSTNGDHAPQRITASASSSSNYGWYSAANTFANGRATREGGEWILMELNQPIAFQQYDLTPLGEKAPLDWKLEGFNGEKWYTVDDRRGFTFPRDKTARFSLQSN